MIIKVMQKDINAATRHGYDEASCPIARAMKRHGLQGPCVDPSEGDLSYDPGGDEEAGWMTRINLYIPRSVKRFVQAFDNKYGKWLSDSKRRKASRAYIRPFSFLVRKER